MSTEPPEPRKSTGRIADYFGFSEEEVGFASFVNLMKTVSLVREPEAGRTWDGYLLCSFVTQGAGWRPLPFGYPGSPPSQLVPKEAAESMERRFASLNGLRKQLDDAKADAGEPNAALIDELGPKAWAAVRGLCDDLEVHRFDSGEVYVLALKMRQALPPERITNAKLIQAVRRIESLLSPDGRKVLQEYAVRLIYRVPAELGGRSVTLNQWDEFLRICEKVENVFFELFPGNYVVVELRDHEGATLHWGSVVGPSFDDVKRQRERMKEME